MKCLAVASLSGLADNQPALGFIERNHHHTRHRLSSVQGEAKLSTLPNGSLACAMPAPRIHTDEGDPLEEDGHYSIEIHGEPLQGLA